MFSDNINETDKPLSGLIKKEGKKEDPNKQNEK